MENENMDKEDKKSPISIYDVCVLNGMDPINGFNGELGDEIRIQTCPNCFDTRGKFYVNIKKDMCNCFHCGYRANAVQLQWKCHPKLEDDNKKFAYKKAIQDVLSRTGSVEIPKYTSKNSGVEVERSSDEYCSAVYMKLLKMLTLKEEHKKDLLRRGMSEEDIKSLRFRSTPSYSERITVVKTLVDQGYDLEGVPGFYKNKGGYWDLKITAPGYLCPVFDGERNLIIGFQIRVDNPIDGNKYLWLSSRGKENGISSGSIATCLPGKNANTVIIIEGILKAAVTWSLLKHEVTVIGVPGVNAIKGLTPYFSRMNNAYIYLAYDMDKYKIKEGKQNEVLAAEMKLKDFKKEGGFLYHNLTWDVKEGKWLETYKGLDDFLYAYSHRDLFISYLVEKSKKIMSINKALV